MSMAAGIVIRSGKIGTLVAPLLPRLRRVITSREVLDAGARFWRAVKGAWRGEESENGKEGVMVCA